MEVYIKRGNEDGHIYVAITPESTGEKIILFDIYGPTVYPDHELPVTWFQPWKFYINVDSVNYIKSQGEDIEIYFDDFKWYED